MKSKKKINVPPANGGRWFLTYSDMITLLLALFIMLYSFSSLNEKKYETLVKNLRVAFNGGTESVVGLGVGGSDSTVSGMVLSGSSAPASSDSSSASDSGTAAPNQALDEVYRILSDYINQNHLGTEIELEKTGSYVQIHLTDVVLFSPNSAKMLSQSEPIMKEIEIALSKVYDRIDHITISGHTADVVVDPVHSDEISWQLSTNRAVTVLNELIHYGLKENKLSIQGYAHYDPIAPDTTEEGRSKNRRVEITVFRSPSTGVGATGRLPVSSDGGSSSAEESSQKSSASSG